ncbi:MAG: dipeptide ABC transporter ATP-binding protein [Oscillospiraceae bacterium]|nr:dipeptide ABC transporter ATP-binding protein [Oscillospiraceae bacterium]
MSNELIRVEHLKKYFKAAKGVVHAVDDVSFTIEAGKTLGVVGESGCGKSTLGRTLIRLQEPTDGKIFFDGENVSALSRQQLWKKRREMQMIFQDPFSSLNPRMTISQTIEEPLRLYQLCPDKASREKKVAELMDTVGLARRLYNAYPHELDGGRRQRIGVARALALNPKFIVCDEPVSALDVSIQAQILNLMQELQAQYHLTYLFITHDLSVVYHISDDIMVMYLGQVVEKAPAEVLFHNPIHPYTQALLSAIPVPSLHDRKEHILMRGEITSPIDPPAECRFASRCRYATDHCRQCDPTLKEVEPNHFVSCFRCDE